jgi:hypothetical protein
MISDGRDFGCFSTTIKRRRTDTLTTKDILNKGSVDDTNRRPRTDLGVNTKEIFIGMLKEIGFRPEGKIMINGLPRAIGNRKTRPLTPRRQDKKNTIKNIRKREATRTTSTDTKRKRRRVKPRNMIQKNGLGKRRKMRHDDCFYFIFEKIKLRNLLRQSLKILRKVFHYLNHYLFAHCL